VAEDHVIVVENGNVIEVDKHSVRVGQRVHGGYVFIDGGGTTLTGRAVIHDREILSRDGFLLVSVNVDKKSGALLKEPEIISRGFVFVRESDELMDTVREHVHEALRTNRQQNGKRQQQLEDAISRVLYNETRRRPMVFAIINEI
jgi:ribonuclease J